MQVKDITVKQLILLTLIIILLIFGFIYHENVTLFVYNFMHMFKPFFVGVIFAFFLNLPMHFLEKKVFKKEGRNVYIRSLTIFLSIVIFMLIAALLLVVVIPEIIASILSLIKSLPGLIDRAQILVKPYAENIPQAEPFLKSVDEMLPELSSWVMKYLKTNWNLYFNTTTSYFTLLLNQLSRFIVSLIFAVLILLNKEKVFAQFKNALRAYLPTKVFKYLVSVSTMTNDIFKAFITGNLVESILNILIYFIVLSLFGFQYAFLFSILIGVGVLVPIIGKSFASTVSAFLTLITQGPLMAVVFFVTFFVTNQVLAIFIKPRVIGNRTGLPSLWTFLIASIATSIFGFWGIFFCIPISGVLYKLFSLDVKKRLQSKRLPIEE